MEGGYVAFIAAVLWIVSNFGQYQGHVRDIRSAWLPMEPYCASTGTRAS